MNSSRLYMHNGCGNHGCEAIVRSTFNILGKPKAILFSFHPKEDIYYGLDQLLTIRSNGSAIKKFEPYHFLSWFMSHAFHNADLQSYRVFHNLLSEKTPCSEAYSIGGDNYCYRSFPHFLESLNRILIKKHIRTILWGCSIEPALLKEKRIVEDLKRYSLIIARESITYNALLQAGIDKNTKLYPDPAFILEKADIPIPENFAEGNTVGINISPLINRYANDPLVSYQNYLALIKHIILSTDMQIELIPHVVQEGRDDRVALRKLYNEYKDTGRIVLIDDHNCMELKGYISRCRLFICARTHASIAAYSTGVPTLVVGYSVKAKGIAEDIFGTYENYVVPVQSLKSEEDLIAAFEWLRHHEDRIRAHLKEFMPSYCAKAWEAGKEIQQLTS